MYNFNCVVPRKKNIIKYIKIQQIYQNVAVLGFCNTGTFSSFLLGKLSEMGYFDGMNFRIHFLRANILKSSTFGIPLGTLDGIHIPDSFSAFLTTLAVLAYGQLCNCPHQTT